MGIVSKAKSAVKKVVDKITGKNKTTTVTTTTQPAQKLGGVIVTDTSTGESVKTTISPTTGKVTSQEYKPSPSGGGSGQAATIALVNEQSEGIPAAQKTIKASASKELQATSYKDILNRQDLSTAQKASLLAKKAYQDKIVLPAERARKERERQAAQQGDVVRFGKVDYSATGDLPYQQRGTGYLETTPYTETELLERAGMDKGGARVEYTRRVNEEVQKNFTAEAQQVYENTAQQLQQKYQNKLDGKAAELQRLYNEGKITEEQFKEKIETYKSNIERDYKRDIENTAQPFIDGVQKDYETAYQAKIRRFNDRELVNRAIVSIPLFIAVGAALPAAGGIAGGIMAAGGAGLLTVDIVNRVQAVKAGQISGKVAAGTLLIDTGATFLGAGIGSIAKGSINRAASAAALDRATVRSVIKGINLEVEIKRLNIDPATAEMLRSYKTKGFSINIVESTLRPANAADAAVLPKISSKQIVITNKAGVIENSVVVGSVIASRGKQVFSADVVGDFVGVRDNIQTVSEGVLATGRNLKEKAIKNIQRAYEEQKYLTTNMPSLVENLEGAKKIRVKSQQDYLIQETDLFGNKRTKAGRRIEIYELGSAKSPTIFDLQDLAGTGGKGKLTGKGRTDTTTRQMGNIIIEDSSRAPTLFERSSFEPSLSLGVGEFGAPAKAVKPKPRQPINFDEGASLFEKPKPGETPTILPTEREPIKDYPTMVGGSPEESSSLFYGRGRGGAETEILRTPTDDLLGLNSGPRRPSNTGRTDVDILDLNLIKDFGRSLPGEATDTRIRVLPGLMSKGTSALGLNQNVLFDFSLSDMSIITEGQKTNQTQEPRLRTRTPQFQQPETGLDFGLPSPTNLELPGFGFFDSDNEGGLMERKQRKATESKDEETAYQASLGSVLAGFTEKVTARQAKRLGKRQFSGIELRPELEIIGEERKGKSKKKDINSTSLFD